MIIETIRYQKEKGWSKPEFPNLDSENTLILIFSAPEFFDDTAPIKTLGDCDLHNQTMALTSIYESK